VGIGVLLAVRALRFLRSLHESSLLQAAIEVSTSYDALVDLFQCVGNFLDRLRIYTEIPFSTPIFHILVKIMVEVLLVLSLATKQIKEGRLSKWFHILYTVLLLNLDQRNM